MTKRKTTEQFKEEVYQRNQKYPDIPMFLCEDQEYINSHAKLWFTCNNGHKWQSAPTTVVSRKMGCPICGREKHKKTMLDKYGATNSFQVPELKDKMKDTMKKKYGVEYSGQSKELFDKSKETCIKKYGVEHPLQNDEIKQKKANTCKEKYGTPHYSNSTIPTEAFEKLSDKAWLEEQHLTLKKTLVHIGRDLNVYYGTVKLYLDKHNIPQKYFYSSAGEREVVDFVNNCDVDTEQNIRTIISPHELDIVIPSKNIAIEFNGVFWHSELNGKTKKYHLEKTESCEDKGIRLIHIFENEWKTKADIVKSRLNSIFGTNERIFARKCEIRVASTSTTKAFLNQTHIQGYSPSSINLALVYDDKVVALMTFGKSRFNKNYEYELIRYSTALNTNIVGGASKLLTHFIRNYSPTSIISYSDRRWNTGNLYKTLGFDFLHHSSPNYFYFKSDDITTLYSRISFQKHKLKDKLEVFDPLLSEWDNMKNNGYDRIWDCGNSVWGMII